MEIEEFIRLVNKELRIRALKKRIFDRKEFERSTISISSLRRIYEKVLSGRKDTRKTSRRKLSYVREMEENDN